MNDKPQDVMELIVHPGIGDIGWLISKLSTTGRQFDLVIAEDSKTRRSIPLVDMLPCIRSAKYGGMDLYYTLAQAGNALFADYVESQAKGQKLYMSMNRWLEDGKRIEGFLPDLETDYHYPVVIPPLDEEWAERQADKAEKSVGIYTSSYGGIRNWNAWTDHEWAEFIKRVYEEFPRTTFFLIGARWDMDMRRPMLDVLDYERIPYVDMIGKTSLAQAVALIKNMDYFAGYASGMTILADVVYQPCLMLYPLHLQKMMYAWPDPMHLANGFHQAHVWDRPSNVYAKIRKHLERFLG